MKIFLILFFLILKNPASAGMNKHFSVDSLRANKKPDHSVQDNWLSSDKGMHLVGSFIAAGITANSFKRFAEYSDNKSVNIGVSFSIGLGLIKEVYDGQQRKNRFSYKDLSADLLGSFLAYLVFK
jgi:putative lipoprotein